MSSSRKTSKIYTAGDLGGFQKLDEYPIMTYGPFSKSIKAMILKLLMGAAYSLAAFWYYLFDKDDADLSLDYNDNKAYEDDWTKIESDLDKALPVIQELTKQREVVKEILSTDLKNLTKEIVLEYFNKLLIR